jgi:hypothetical protein
MSYRDSKLKSSKKSKSKSPHHRSNLLSPFTMEGPSRYESLSGSTTKIIWMSPSDYINATYDMRTIMISNNLISCNTGFISREEYFSEIENDDRTSKYTAAMKKGDKFSMPWLQYFIVSGQDGNHRAFAALKAGYDMIPVSVTYPTDHDFPSSMNNIVKSIILNPNH